MARCARVVDGLRAINTKIVRLSGSVEQLAAAADDIESLLASLDAVTQRRARETFRFDTGEPNSVMPFIPATGAFDPLALELAMRVENQKLAAECAFASHYESSQDSLQGGRVAACFAPLLAFAVTAHGKTGPTVSLAVRFVKRAPINQPLRFESWVETVDGEKFAARGH